MNNPMAAISNQSILPFMLALALAGCARITVDGARLHEGQWQTDTAELQRRFKFETNCQEPVAFTVLSSSDDYATTVGAAGCGQRVVYKRLMPGGWVADSASGALR